MRTALAALFLLASGTAFAGSRDFLRFSGERVLTGTAVGTQDVWAGELDVEPFHIGSYAIGFSVRKESKNVTDGFGIGLYGTRTWLGSRPVNVVTEGGVRWFIPTVEYFDFQYGERDGQTVWQRWNRVSTNAYPKTIPTNDERRGDGAAVAPVIGLYAQRRTGPFTFRAGVRATIARFGLDAAQRSPSGEMRILQEDRYWQIIIAPVFSVGF